MFSTLTGFEVSLLGSGYIRPSARVAFPAIEISSTPEKVDIHLTAPGIDAKALDISIQQNVLSVSGRREAQLDEKAARHRQERFSGEFRRVITLPEDVDPQRVEATYVDGVVRIRVQRREAAKPRQIEIHQALN